MHKSTIIDDKTAHLECEEYPLPRGMSDFHEAYGLWICLLLRNASWPPSDRIKPRCFKFYCLSHLINGQGWYWTAGEKVEIFQANQGVLSTPGVVQEYGGDGTVYTEDSVCFTGPVADRLFQSGVIRDGILNIGDVRRLLPIIDLAQDPSVSSQLRANITLQNLLVDLYFENQHPRPSEKRSRIDLLLEAIAANPESWWTVSDMAKMCNISQTQFRRDFNALTGMAPKQYVDRFKIQRASERLCSARGSVADIAMEFGYRDPYHFSRRFKVITGFSPRQYRREFSLFK